MKILVIAPSWIGDLVMSQCLYKQLKQNDPNCEIHVLAPKWCLPILERMPEVSKRILMPIGHGEFNFSGRKSLAKTLRPENYDQAYILPNSWKSALIPFLAKIPHRYGWKGEMRYVLINHMRKNKADFPLLIERYVALACNENIHSAKDLAPIAKPALTVKHLSALEIAKFHIRSTEKPLGLCPGAEYGITKKWPPIAYATVATHYLKEHSTSEVWIFGSNKDADTAQEIINDIPDTFHNRIRMLTGSTTLTEAVDLLAMCNLVICNDSGLMHITAAVKTRLVAIFGSTSTKYTPPLAEDALIVESDEPCHPCFKKQCQYGTLACLTKITPKDVIAKITAKWSTL